jgi:beta-N-acetylhexosaminidase
VLQLVVFALLTTDAGVLEAEVDAGIPAQALNARPLGRRVNEERVERVLQSLTTRERAGQLLLAYPQIDRTGPVEVGLLFVGNSLKNIAKAKEKIDSSRVRAKIPPFVAVDMEGGPSNRMKSVRSLKALPSARDMALLEEAEVKRWGRKVGDAMKSIGLNLNLAPVLDVAPSGHMERNGRSFSGDRDTVVKKAMAYSRGLLEAGVVPIGKHYPGYGDTDGDSDHALVTVDWPRERVLAEAETFVRAKEVLGGVMLANTAAPLPDGQATGFIRPHEFTLADAGAAGLPVTLRRLQRTGAAAALETVAGDGAIIEVSIADPPAGLAPGAALVLVPTVVRAYPAV